MAVDCKRACLDFCPGLARNFFEGEDVADVSLVVDGETGRLDAKLNCCRDVGDGEVVCIRVGMCYNRIVTRAEDLYVGIDHELGFELIDVLLVLLWQKLGMASAWTLQRTLSAWAYSPLFVASLDIKTAFDVAKPSSAGWNQSDVMNGTGKMEGKTCWVRLLAKKKRTTCLSLFMEAFGLVVEEELSTMATQYWSLD